MRIPYTHRFRSFFMSKQIRFIAAGLLNTAVDFSVFNVALHVFSTKIWIANICSTSIAMVVSFAINKKAVFGDGKQYSPQQFAAFVIVTAVGLWGLQTIIVVGMNNILRLTIVGAARSTGNSAAIRWIIPNVAKGMATIISAIWNYFWYDRVIFAKKDVSLSEWM